MLENPFSFHFKTNKNPSQNYSILPVKLKSHFGDLDQIFENFSIARVILWFSTLPIRCFKFWIFVVLVKFLFSSHLHKITACSGCHLEYGTSGVLLMNQKSHISNEFLCFFFDSLFFWLILLLFPFTYKKSQWDERSKEFF